MTSDFRPAASGATALGDARGVPSDSRGTQALVLAAGRSTRIAGELDGRSKVLVDIGGQTVLGRNLRWLADSGVTAVWINLHYRPDDIIDAVGDGSRFGVRVRYSEEPELLGTAGAFRKLADEWASPAGPVLLVYGDNVSQFDLRALVDHHVSSGAVATVALFDTRVHGNSGIAGGRVVVDGGRVSAFLEGGPAVASPLVNAGVYVLDRAVLTHIPQITAPDFGRDVFPALLAAGAPIAAHVIEADGYCYGIDTPDALARTRAALGVAKTVAR